MERFKKRNLQFYERLLESDTVLLKSRNMVCEMDVEHRLDSGWGNDGDRCGILPVFHGSASGTLVAGVSCGRHDDWNGGDMSVCGKHDRAAVYFFGRFEEKEA